MVGSATRFVERLHTAPKVYRALLRFGTETTTDDREGAPTREAPLPERARVEAALAAFRGVIQQRPPAYAAVKVNGRHAYDRARGGEIFELPAREVRILRLEVTRWPSDAELGLLVVCTSGTYIRSIARDLGRAAGTAAHLAALRRLAVGALDVRDAIGVDALRGLGRDGALLRLRPADDALLALDPAYLDAPVDRLVGEEAGA